MRRITLHVVRSHTLIRLLRVEGNRQRARLGEQLLKLYRREAAVEAKLRRLDEDWPRDPR
jgi:hypothetical protein